MANSIEVSQYSTREIVIMYCAKEVMVLRHGGDIREIEQLVHKLIDAVHDRRNELEEEQVELPDLP